jgi:hypothetical protein
VEVGEAGRRHLHVVVLHGRQLTVDQWRSIARASGFGYINVGGVGQSAQDRASVASYLSKSLPASAAALVQRGAVRPRPVSWSRRWPAIG